MYLIDLKADGYSCNKICLRLKGNALSCSVVCDDEKVREVDCFNIDGVDYTQYSLFIYLNDNAENIFNLVKYDIGHGHKNTSHYLLLIKPTSIDLEFKKSIGIRRVNFTPMTSTSCFDICDIFVKIPNDEIKLIEFCSDMGEYVIEEGLYFRTYNGNVKLFVKDEDLYRKMLAKYRFLEDR